MASCLLAILAAFPGVHSQATVAEPWESWLDNFGHDSYRYPAWINSQRQRCSCDVSEATAVHRTVTCHDGGEIVDWEASADLTWCVAQHYLLSHMPEFDLDFLPSAISVEGASMLDDNIAFTLMAWNASSLSPRPPLDVAIPYLLPYALYHEARANWRPIFFAKYFKPTSNDTNSRAVLTTLLANGTPLMNWTQYTWPSMPTRLASNSYELGPFASGTAPPVVAPFDFAAYGYGSCTAWSTFLTSALKAVGVPARQVGTPCWNTGEFAGLATENSNVSLCWSAGPDSGPSGGKYLNNHNWVEYWDNELGDWHFVDVATSSIEENTWFCGAFSQEERCSCTSDAGKAAADHDIFAPTWTMVSDGAARVDGGAVIDVAKLQLSSGEAVSPLVWAPRLVSPRGKALRNVGLRVVNRTSYYRCRPAPSKDII